MTDILHPTDVTADANGLTLPDGQRFKNTENPSAAKDAANKQWTEALFTALLSALTNGRVVHFAGGVLTSDADLTYNPTTNILTVGTCSLGSTGLSGSSLAYDGSKLTAATVPLTALATQAAQSVVINGTGSTAVPTAVAIGTDRVLGRDGSGNLSGIQIDVEHLSTALTNLLALDWALLTMSGSGVGANTAITMAQSVVSTPNTWPAVSSNAQQVPRAGTYLCVVYADWAISATSNPTQMTTAIRKGGSIQQLVTGTRFSTTAAGTVAVVGATIKTVTTPSSEKWDWRSTGDSSNTITNGIMILIRIGA